MAKPIILVGNGINNISNSVSWSQLLEDLIDDLGVDVDKKSINSKPFPLLYEEIYIKSIQKGDIKEKELKSTISEKVGVISANEIHHRITSGTFSDILTTNYELTLEHCISDGGKIKNDAVKREIRYSVYRRGQIDEMNFWHIHGDMTRPASILLGYEHYSGQLQMMREYVHYGPKKGKSFNPLERRLSRKGYQIASWIDHFFTGKIHILGLSLDFIETDLWWLITYRARKQHEEPRRSGKDSEAFTKVLQQSEINYYYPSGLSERIAEKLQLMKALNINTIPIDQPHGFDYYHSILDRIEAG